MSDFDDMLAWRWGRDFDAFRRSQARKNEVFMRWLPRAQRIASDRALGLTLKEVGEKHGISAERVRQITWRLARLGLNG